MRIQRLAPLAIFAAGFGYGLLYLGRHPSAHDEGIAVFGAARVLDGEIPYRDFFTQYAPGQFYTLAALFAAFGRSLVVERIWDAALRAGTAALAWSIAARLGPAPAALIAWVGALVWLGEMGPSSYSAVPGLLFALASARLVITQLERPGPRWPLPMAGVAAGAAVLYRHDIGAYVIAVASVLIGLAVRRGVVAGRVAPALLRYLGGSLLVIAPVVITLCLLVDPGVLFYDLLVFPLAVFPTVRGIDYPVLVWCSELFCGNPGSAASALGLFPYYLPLAVYAAGFLVALRRASGTPGRQLGLLLMVTLGSVFFAQAAVRSDMPHLAPFVVVAFVVLAACWPAARRAKRPALASAAVLGTALLLLPSPIARRVKNLSEIESPEVQGIPASAGVQLDRGLARATTYLRRRVSEDQAIFIGEMRHDRLFANHVMLYFLTGRRAATRYHELHPGLATRDDVQREIVAELCLRDVPYMVRSSLFLGMERSVGGEDGSRRLDNFLMRHYRPLKRFGPFHIYRRARECLEEPG